MYFFRRLAQLSVLLSFVRSELPNDQNVNIDGLSYRLPINDLNLIHAELEVTPYILTSPTPEQLFTFDGRATLEIRVLRDNLTALILHENLKNITSVDLSTADGTPILLDEVNQYDRIEQFNLLRINLREGETLNRSLIHKLSVTYTGHINKSPLKRGLYAGTYRDTSGNQQWYITTHLHPTHGRELLPCLDEPRFKSTFDITVVRSNEFTQTFSNMDVKATEPMGNYTREVFNRTPRMSAYQIGIHLSTEFAVLADNLDAARPFRVIGRPNAINQTSFAMRIGPSLIDGLEGYLGIGYYTMAEGVKSDHLAIPELATEGAENWGLNSYRENCLLIDEEDTNVVDRANAAISIARGIAHRWFGNYVTANWWRDAWLNDGLATYFAYFTIIASDQSLWPADRFNLEVLHSAFQAHQADFGVRLVSRPVNSPAEISEHLAGPGHLKAAALIQMIHSMQPADFRKAMTNYLNDRALNAADADDLYHFITAAEVGNGPVNVPFSRGILLNTWMNQIGYPVIFADVDTARAEIRLRQERFFERSSGSDTRWPLLINYVSGIDHSVPTIYHRMQARTSTMTLPTNNTTWYILNYAQRGFYRVNYNRENWQRIASALKTQPSRIHRLNVAQIVDDILNLMRQPGPPWHIMPRDAFYYLDFLRVTPSYFAWYPAINGFTWLRNRLLHLPRELEQFDEAILRFMALAILHHGYEVRESEGIQTAIIRMKLLAFACTLGHRGCITDAVSRFEAFKENPSENAVHPNLRPYVFCEGLRHDDHDAFEFLYQRYSSSNNQVDQLVTLRALGCTSNATNIIRLLDMITYDGTSTGDLTPTPVLPQNRVEAFTWLYEGNRGNAKVALQYLKGNVERVRRAVVLSPSFASLLTNMAAHLDEEGLQDMQQWLGQSETQIMIPEHKEALDAISVARSAIAWGDSQAEYILDGLPTSSSTTVTLSTFALLFALLAMMLK